MSVSATADATPSRTELLFNGKPVAKERVAAIFLLATVGLILLGLGINYYLTDGTWVVEEGLPARDAVATGEGDAYITGATYDVVTTVVLVSALVLMGAGFLQRMMGSRTALAVGYVLLVLAVVLWAASYTGYLTSELLVWITLGVALPFVIRAYLDVGGRAHAARGVGFVLFGLYWATQAMRLFTIENGDYVNMTFSFAAVPLANYFAYHEILSAQRGETPRSLLWLSGAASIATGVYFITHKIQAVSEWLILRVSEQTTWMLHLFGQDVVRMGGDPTGSRIYYPMEGLPLESGAGYFAVQIILACTAIQSIMIFVGGILALQSPKPGDGTSGKPNVFHRLNHTYNARRWWAFLLTVPLIYVLNLFRNTIIIWMSGQDQAVMYSQDGAVTNWLCSTVAYCGLSPDVADNYAAFWFSHNVIGKGGSLLALIIIAFIVFRILPELYDSIIGLMDLRRRRGPLERWVGERFGRGGNGGEPTPAPAETPETPETPKSPSYAPPR